MMTTSLNCECLDLEAGVDCLGGTGMVYQACALRTDRGLCISSVYCCRFPGLEIEAMDGCPQLLFKLTCAIIEEPLWSMPVVPDVEMEMEWTGSKQSCCFFALI